MKGNGLRLGVAFWGQISELFSSIADTFQDLGCEVTYFAAEGELPDDVDTVLILGPFGPIVPLANRLLALPKNKRPLMVVWMTEQFSNPAWPEQIHRFAGMVRSGVERSFYRQNAIGEWDIIDPRLRWITSRAKRLRYYGDLHWLHQEGLLSVLAVGSLWIADFLQVRGFSPVVAFIGTHPTWGADLGLERDIQVLWIGSMGSDRRGHLLKRIRAELKSKGVKLTVVDGQEHPYVFGHERTILLNRSKIVLNLLRTPWDNHSLRFFLAAPNRTLVISEPTSSHIPFTPGTHYVEATVENLTDAICYYLAHEQKRAAIAERAYHLTASDLTMKSTARHLLDSVFAASCGPITPP